jgi:YVTN family beta-propeller protein
MRGPTIYTANGPSGDITVIDTESRHVVQRVPVGKQPWGLATVRVREGMTTAQL